MTTAKEIHEKLSVLQPIYDEILQKHERWIALQTLDQAIIEYKEHTILEEKKLNKLRQRKNDLKEEYRRLTRPSDFGSESFETSTGPVWIEHQKSTLHNQSFGSPIAANHSMKVRARKRLQKFAYRLSLNNTILGQINRIADDIDRPIGEALILLDWNVFMNRAAHESVEVYFVRLIDWSEALQEYRSRLTTDIDNLETRFRRWLHIWEHWLVRNQTPQDKANWTIFISESCRAMQEEGDRLEKELTHLADELDKLKAHLQNTEGRA